MQAHSIARVCKPSSPPNRSKKISQLAPNYTSPDSAYSSNAEKAKKLQVPPDLNEVSPDEQFVLPGDGGGVITRNTLLPVVGQGQYVREGDRDWLMLSATPEALWPRLLKFINDEGFTVQNTQPLVGSIATDWQSGGGDSGTLASAEGNKERVRLSLRLERIDSGDPYNSRLLARYQVESGDNETTNWSARAAHPEKSSIVLKRMLAFLGIEEQQARGLIPTQAAESLLASTEFENREGRSSLVVHHGLRSSRDALGQAISLLGLSVDERASSRTMIAVKDKERKFVGSDDTDQFVVLLQAAHVSKVNIDLATPEGAKLDRNVESQFLSALRNALTNGV